MEFTPVDDTEDLCRAIRADRGEFTVSGDGKLVFSSSAFNDVGRQPSVDRSALRRDPRDTRKSPTDGVTLVRTTEVRAIRTLRVDPSRKNDDRTYQVDAIHRPIVADTTNPNGNLAHCQIECCPTIASGTHFKKLKEALALLANTHGFVVTPTLPQQGPPPQR